MDDQQLYSLITNKIQQDPTGDYFIGVFLNQLDNIITSEQISSSKVTQITILIEGFYRFVPGDSTVKRILSDIRIERWANHFGTPTITFLLTFADEIECTCSWFAQSEAVNDKLPWDVDVGSLKLDSQNHVMVNVESITSIEMPKDSEQTGQFLKTHNPSGGFTTTPCDPVSQKFLEYAEEIAEQGGRVLEVGAAFGAASLQALSKSAAVFCNDIEPENLAVISKRAQRENSLTGDDNKLVLVPGTFPEELTGLPKASFDAILICRVLHFFTGDRIEASLNLLADYLKPGGRLFVVCETPFLKNWQKFIPEHERRVQEGWQWPGEITNPADYESSGRAASLPKFVHWITKEVLANSLNKITFNLDYISYIDRKGQFPDDLLLDGRESIGAVACKPC